MELQIQDLVSSIKSEGIESAKKEAEKIISEAQSKAEAIINQAKADAKKILDDNQKEIEILRQSASVSAQQAKRDAVISFRKEINEQYNNLLTKNVGKALNDVTLAKLITAVIADNDVKNLSVEVKEVSEGLKAELAEAVKNGLEIRPVKTVKAGFKVVFKDGSGFIDCTDEELSSMLSPFLGQIIL